MAARKGWLLRIPEIRGQLAGMEVPVIDRAMFERIFRVRRRRAIQLMQFFGTLQTGQSFLLDRLQLIRQLEPIEAGAEFAYEKKRRQRLADSLEKMARLRRAAEVKLTVPPTAGAGQLPEGASLGGGVLRVEVASAEELLGRLYALAQVAAEDYDSFRRAAGGK